MDALHALGLTTRNVDTIERWQQEDHLRGVSLNRAVTHETGITLIQQLNNLAARQLVARLRDHPKLASNALATLLLEFPMIVWDPYELAYPLHSPQHVEELAEELARYLQGCHGLEALVAALNRRYANRRPVTNRFTKS